MALPPYEEFAQEPLVFPIGGKNYTLPPRGIPDGIALADIISGKDEAAQELSGVDLWRMLLGDVWDQMIADGVPLEAATSAGLTALADFQYNREYAEQVWRRETGPKAPTNRKARRSKSSTSTAAANTTPSPASTSGTRKSRKS
jgi:hypothetical protein